jgi:DnaJ-class molecular chaperone
MPFPVLLASLGRALTIPAALSTPLPTMKPISARFPVPLGDFITGRNYSFLYARRVRCHCATPPGGFLCPRCRGHPLVTENISVAVALPRGAADPYATTVPGVTDHTDARAPGDLVVVFEVQRHPLFTRINQNVIAHVHLSSQDQQVGYYELVLPSGERTRVHFRPGDTTVHLKGKGLPFPDSDAVGEFILNFV